MSRVSMPERDGLVQTVTAVRRLFVRHAQARRTEQALASWQQLAEAQERELGLYRHAARLATDALDRHKLWCGYRRDAPGDSSFYDAERALSRAANSHSDPESARVRGRGGEMEDA